MKKRFKIVYLFQLICVGVLFPYAIAKFFPSEVDDYIFREIGLYDFGRYLVGSIEIIACLLLVSRMAVLGAIIVTWVMLGALIAHLTVIGIAVEGSGYQIFFSLIVVLSSSIMVIYLRRKEIPFISSS